jgi:hypothetical protein
MLVLKIHEENEVSIGKAGDVLTGPIIVKGVKFRNSNTQVAFNCQDSIVIVRSDAVNKTSDHRKSRPENDRTESD